MGQQQCTDAAEHAPPPNATQVLRHHLHSKPVPTNLWRPSTCTHQEMGRCPSTYETWTLSIYQTWTIFIHRGRMPAYLSICTHQDIDHDTAGSATFLGFVVLVFGAAAWRLLDDTAKSSTTAAASPSASVPLLERAELFTDGPRLSFVFCASSTSSTKGRSVRIITSMQQARSH